MAMVGFVVFARPRFNGGGNDRFRCLIIFAALDLLDQFVEGTLVLLEVLLLLDFNHALVSLAVVVQKRGPGLLLLLLGLFLSLDLHHDLEAGQRLVLKKIKLTK